MGSHSIVRTYTVLNIAGDHKYIYTLGLWLVLALILPVLNIAGAHIHSGLRGLFLFLFYRRLISPAHTSTLGSVACSVLGSDQKMAPP